jgi:hypothetical protein
VRALKVRKRGAHTSALQMGHLGGPDPAAYSRSLLEPRQYDLQTELGVYLARLDFPLVVEERSEVRP